LPADPCAAQDLSPGGFKPILGSQNCKVYFESQNTDAAMQGTTDACEIDLAPESEIPPSSIAWSYDTMDSIWGEITTARMLDPSTRAMLFRT
jgi:hypothetical protein